MTELSHFQAPQADFSPGPDCYQKCQDWVGKCELLLSGPLVWKSKEIKASYVLIWAGKIGRTHIKSLNLSAEQKKDPKILLQKFLDWTKRKSNALAAAANFRRLEQGDLSLAEYIDKATVLCDQCEYPPEARDKLLRDAIVIGQRFLEAYFKCIEKGSVLTLEEAITIVQNEDATASQIGYMRPEFKGGLTQAAVHQLHEKQGARPRQKKQQKERGGSDNQKRNQERYLFQLWSKACTAKKSMPCKERKVFQVWKRGTLWFCFQVQKQRREC